MALKPDFLALIGLLEAKKSAGFTFVITFGLTLPGSTFSLAFGGVWGWSREVLVAIVAFGLSMDYELFLLSRIREEHLAGKSNVESVAVGLQRSARIITAAAVLLAVVFAAFVTSGVTSIKTMGFGVALAVILDATIVRGLLVPALMRLFGENNWWAPKWMQRFTLHH